MSLFQPSDERIACDELARQLAPLDVKAKVDRDGLWLTNWAKVRISIGMCFAAPQPQDQWLARVDVTFSYNVDVPYVAIPSRAIGVGGDRTTAIANAMNAWAIGTAPALISHIYGQCRYGADFAPDGDELGIKGWNCITGPYLVTGTEAVKAETAALVRENPLIAPVRAALESELDRAAHYHSLVLYRARTFDSEFTDVLIDNQANDRTAEILKGFSLPTLSDPDGFIGVRQFILCCRPS